ncbi:hypothetical protein GCM10025867_49910 (plasmid) [Frondihabitans sucicola]|uniref:Helix-turn-helix domain-containing protein n=1 Tax=Frondihabitans sucicola TaxID=1268041 RepID=A0ABM8GW85_9MICO|nr:hypothetical protein [Frondihabitans sucicola]BDZ52750.1 hypothetical protein GCM10025867_49910 [Frondihabitans sucicola]
MSGRGAVAPMAGTLRLPSGGKDYLPIAPIRQHITTLRATGTSMAKIATACGVSQDTLYNLMATDGGPRRSRVRHRILKSTAIAILAVTPEVLSGAVAPVGIDRVSKVVWVPVETIRDHIRTLQASGMTLRLIGEQAGFDRRRLSSYLATKPTVANPTPVERVPRAAARRILAVTPFEQQSPHKAVDSAPYVRRLQALAVMGYSYGMIGKMLGCSAQNVLIKLTKPTMQIVHAEAVKAIYGKYAFTPVTYDNSHSAAHGRRNVARARAQGWLGPMEWDDIDTGVVALDLPESDSVDGLSSAVDEVALQGVLLGEHSTTLTRAEQWEAIRRLRDMGVGINETARRIGMSDRQVLRRVHELRDEEAMIAESEGWDVAA